MTAWSDIFSIAALQPWLVTAPVLLLAALRWLGCLTCLPALGAAGVTVRLKIALAMLLAIVVLPAVTATVSSGSVQELSGTQIARWLAAASGEFVLGCVLGLGVRVLFGSLSLAGELIDQQAGLAMRQALNPVIDGEAGPTSAMLAWLGTAAILLWPPAGGHLALARAMLQQFTAIPVGSATGIPSSTLLMVVVQQSLHLAVNVTAPVVAAMSLVTLAVGLLGRSAPQLRVDSIVAPIRAVVCLIVLTVTISGFGVSFGDRLDALVEVGPQWLSQTDSAASLRNTSGDLPSASE